jgi:D-ribose pyranase
MKKIGTLNQPLSSVIASMGHMDSLVIADAGLPIPSQTQCIDLALTAGVPGFIETVRVVLSELAVERAIIAEEMLSASPHVHIALIDLLGDTPLETMPHEEFKAKTSSAKAIVRTGEFTPFANIILISGVVF